MTGRVCGQLTVLSRAENAGGTKVKWLCVCTCGNQTTVKGYRVCRACGRIRARENRRQGQQNQQAKGA